MARTILLIDGDQYLYRACAATEHETKWDEDNHVLVSNAKEAFDTVASSLKKIFQHFGTEDYVLTFGEGTNFRMAIDPTYKGNRAKTRKPLCYSEVGERLRTEFKCLSFPGLEADDVMGILATKPGPADKIIVARDKDMKTIPGKLWDGLKFSMITEAEADYFHLYQTLVGDTADGYKGCPGVGPKKATKILDEGWCAADGSWHAAGASLNEDNKYGPYGPDPTYAYCYWHMWAAVVEAYEGAGLTEDDALRQARLARILRWADWNSETKTPILWSPPT